METEAKSTNDTMEMLKRIEGKLDRLLAIFQDQEEQMQRAKMYEQARAWYAHPR